MGTRLTVFNQKGGVGKTTTVLNLGAALARRGGTPLLVDLDAQSHLSSILNPGAASGESLFAYYNVGRPLKEVARPVRFGGELIPAHLELVKVDSMFGKGPDILNKLKQGLDAGWEGKCPVLIDCCPVLGEDIFSHAPDSRGAQDYSGLLEELLSSGFLDASSAPGATATC